METKDSRPAMYTNQPTVRRRRRCRQCGWATTTYELTEGSIKQTSGRLGRVMPMLRRLVADYDDEAPEVPRDQG